MYGMFFDDYDTPVFRPPSEAESFILRVTRGCAHNSCTYCNMYRGVKFEKLSDDQIIRQIAMAYSTDAEGVRRVFLADGDALVLPTERLLNILAVLKKYFPNLERVSSYAAPRDILAKSVEELTELRRAGLALLYYGMESGDAQTLKDIRKGVNDKQSIEAGKRVIAAGMKLSIMIILGIAGKEGSTRHALATAHAINEIKPTMLSALSLMLYRGSELKEQFERGEFHPLTPAQLMEELKLIMEHVDLPESEHMIFRSNHVSNYIRLAATLPRDKEQLLEDIDKSILHLKQMKNWDIYNHDFTK
ncbi:MAG: radical SAM protein [Dialister sp.]|nr:radical SAM protein [Dialister sp.]